jgi:hypothetical protein
LRNEWRASPSLQGSAAHTAFVKSEIELWNKIIKTAGIKPE